jgi:hypothetical protein
MPIKSQGISIKQKTSYQLAEVDESGATIKTEITQSADKQKIKNPATGNNVQVTLSKLDGSGTGESHYDFAQCFPVSATVNSHSDVDTNVEVGGQKQDMTMKLNISMSIEPR